MVTELGLELIVPIDSGVDRADAILALGARRSDEPYASEDQELLWTIAQSLAVIEGREQTGRSNDDVCEAVAYGHRHGVSHGRLRPEFVIASGPREAVTPIVTGYSVVLGRTPTEEDTWRASRSWRGPWDAMAAGGV